MTTTKMRITTTTMTTTTTTRAGSKASGATLKWRWQQHSFRAMNTDVHAWLYSAQPRQLAREAEMTFRYFEQLLSRFRPTSELSRLNDHDGSPYIAGPDLYAAVEAALWAAQQTDGVFDPTILRSLEQAGYDRTFEAIDGRLPLAQAAPEANGRLDAAQSQPAARRSAKRAKRYDYRDVHLDALAQTISRPAGLQLDLGGMGKGWTVDRLADDLRPAGHFFINAGGDIYAYGEPHRASGWEINLTRPFDPSAAFATLSLNHHAVATSSIARRRWLKDGMVQHHLIDPRTGCPAETDLVSVSVVAGRTFTAEVYAKTALILGPDAGLAFLEEQDEVEGALVAASGEIILTGGMPALLDRFDPAGYPIGNEGE